MELCQDMAEIKGTLAELRLDSRHDGVVTAGTITVAEAGRAPAAVGAVPQMPGPARFLPEVPCADTTPILVRQPSAAISHAGFRETLRSVSECDVADRTYSTLRR